MDRLVGIVDKSTSVSSSPDKHRVNLPASCHLLRKSIDRPRLAVNQFHSFAAMDQAAQDLKSLQAQLESDGTIDHRTATASLQDLSKSLTTVSLEADHLAGDQARKGFYVPSKVMGYKLMSRKHLTHTHITRD